MGAGRPKTLNPRKFKITIRLTADEIQKVKDKKGDKSIADFIREKIMNEKES